MLEALDARYELGHKLGAGGMGVVYQARDLEKSATVAIKLLHSEASRSLRARFLREARLASQIQHPHVVRVRSYARGAAKRLYLVMDLIEGVALSNLVEANLPASLLTRLLIEVLEALAYVHARGILHRDIKPDNILIGRNTAGSLTAYLTDFGIAGLLEHARDETRLTQEGSAIGTPDYMAPEQTGTTLALTPGVDLYPIGITLYRALSGRMPFAGNTMAVLIAKTQQDPPPPHNLGSWPSGLWTIVERLLARDPALRFRAAADVIHALAPFAAHDARVSDDVWRDLCDGSLSSERRTASLLETLSAHDSAFNPIPSSPNTQRKLWDRSDESAWLESRAEAAEAGAVRVVLVDGPIGIGKSTWAQTVGLKLAESGRFVLMQGGFSSGTAGDGLRIALERAMGTIGRPPSEVKPLAASFLRQHGVEDTQELQDILGFLRPRASRADNHNHGLFLRVLRHITRRRPLMLLLEDIHHDATEVASFLENAIVEAAYDPMPLLIVATLRQDDAEALTRPLARHLLHGDSLQRLTLGPIPREDLVAGLVRDMNVSYSQAEAISDRAAGNPLFAELLAQSGAPRSTSNTADPLPDQLRELMVEHYASLIQGHTEADAVLGRIAILGNPVSISLLEAFCEDLDVDFDDALDTLLELEILVEDHVADTVRFRHPLLAEALASTHAGRKARKLHIRAAELREKRATDLDAEASVIGDHYHAALQPKQATTWWLRGLDYEIAAGDVLRGLHCGYAVFDQLEPGDPRVADVRLKLARLMRERGQLQTAYELLEPLADIADIDTRLLVLERIADIHQEGLESDSWKRWDETLETMKAIVEQASDTGRHAYERALLFRLNNVGTSAARQEAFALEKRILEHEPDRDDRIYILTRAFWTTMMIHVIEATNTREEMGRIASELDTLTRNSSGVARAEALRVMGFHAIWESLDMSTPLALIHQEAELYRQTGRLYKLVSALDRQLFTLLFFDAPLEPTMKAFSDLQRVYRLVYEDGRGTSPQEARTTLFEAYLCWLGERPMPDAYEQLIQAVDDNTITPLIKVAGTALIGQMRILNDILQDDWPSVVTRLSELRNVALGWGVPIRLTQAVGEALIERLSTHPDKALQEQTQRFLELARTEWGHILANPERVGFLDAMLEQSERLAVDRRLASHDVS